MRFLTKKYGLIVALLLLIAGPAFAVRTGQLGGIKSDNTYDFVIEDAVMKVTAGSSINVAHHTDVRAGSVGDSYETLTADENGLTVIGTYAGRQYFTLPDCDSTPMEYTIVAGAAQYIHAVVSGSEDTIAYASMSAGDDLQSAGAKGDSVTLSCYAADTWIPINMKGSWVDANNVL